MCKLAAFTLYFSDGDEFTMNLVCFYSPNDVEVWCSTNFACYDFLEVRMRHPAYPRSYAICIPDRGGAYLPHNTRWSGPTSAAVLGR
jgi:hypothetical protein